MTLVINFRFIPNILYSYVNFPDRYDYRFSKASFNPNAINTVLVAAPNFLLMLMRVTIPRIRVTNTTRLASQFAPTS